MTSNPDLAPVDEAPDHATATVEQLEQEGDVAADFIEALGPVWAYWAYPMERECGKIQRAAKGHRFPWASVDKVVLHQAQLDMVKLRYRGMAEELALRRGGIERGEAVGNCKFQPPRCSRGQT